MDYEKKYKETLERAKRYYLDNKDGIEATMLEYIFPELQESEDERIREKLKHYLEVRRCRTHNDEEYVNCNHFLAWLEKQKPVEQINGEDYGIDGLFHAIRILERTLGEVEGYQSDDGILAHKAAIAAIKSLYRQTRNVIL